MQKTDPGLVVVYESHGENILPKVMEGSLAHSGDILVDR